MSMQDPISDMIARVKNAQSRGHKEVLLDSSKIKLGICKVLESEGYIKKVELVGEQPKQEIKITLKYFEDLLTNYEINYLDAEQIIDQILDWMDARSIAELIIDEHPQIIALIISYLDAGQAADVLGLLPELLQSEIVRRIATLQTVGPDALSELENVMQSKFKANASLRAAKVGGVDAAARIMNFTKQNMEQRIMKDIARNDRELMQAITESMFVFDNLIMSDERSLQTLLRSVDNELQFWL